MRAIEEGAKGTVWFGTDHGLYRMGEGIERVQGSFGLDGASRVRALHRDRKGSLWVAAEHGLFRGERGTFERIELPGAANDLICAITEDREENLWLATAYGGLQRLRTLPVRVLTTQDGLNHNDVWTIAPARDGGVWIGSSGGLNRYKNEAVLSMADKGDDFRRSLRSVLEDRFGGLILGTAFEGLRHGLRWRNSGTLVNRVVPNHAIRAALEDENGDLWFGTRNGLIHLRSLRVSHFLGGSNGTLVDDTHGEAWLYTSDGIYGWRENGRLWKRKNGVWRSQEVRGDEPAAVGLTEDEAVASYGLSRDFIDDLLPSYDIRAIVSDGRGGIWLGTSSGLALVQGRRVSALSEKDGLIDNEVRALCIDSQGVLWIGTDSGLSRWKNGALSAVTSARGLPECAVHVLIEDDFGCLWLGTRRGLARVALDELHAVADGDASHVEVRIIDEGQGLLTREINGGCQPSAYKSPNGALWFPTTRGVAIVNPGLLSNRRTGPPVHIESMDWEGGPFAPGSRRAVLRAGAAWPAPRLEEAARGARLPAGAGRSISIKYTGIYLSEPNQLRFHYKLEGVDADWVDAGARRTAYYTNLKPGRYVFQARALGPEGVSPVPASLAFSIAPFFYQTLWFRAAGALALCGVAGGWHRWNLKQERTRARIKREEALAKERSRIARDLHDDLGSLVSQLGLMAGLAPREKLPPGSHDPRELAHAASRAMDQLVWIARPEHDQLEHFAHYLADAACSHLRCAGIEAVIDFPTPIPPIPMRGEIREQVFFAAKEVIHNVIKHSEADRALLRLRFVKGRLLLEFADNGRGFPCPLEDPKDAAERPSSAPAEAAAPFDAAVASSSPAARNGLRNLRQRLELCGGRLDVINGADGGATVRFDVPLSDAKDSSH